MMKNCNLLLEDRSKANIEHTHTAPMGCEWQPSGLTFETRLNPQYFFLSFLLRIRWILFHLKCTTKTHRHLHFSYLIYFFFLFHLSVISSDFWLLGVPYLLSFSLGKRKKIKEVRFPRVKSTRFFGRAQSFTEVMVDVTSIEKTRRA